MISVTVPVYNEENDIENNLKILADYMEGYEKGYEIVVVDDGSSDNTVSVVNKISSKNRKIRLVRHDKNLGVGAALITGLEHSKGDIIISIDSDLTYGPENFPAMVRALEEKNADIVIGTPFMKGYDREIPLLRRVLSRGANYVDKLVFGLNFSTPTCIFRAWRKKAAKDVKITFNRFEGVSESAIDAFRKGYKVIEIPVRYRMKAGRVSKMRVGSEVGKHLKMIYRLRFGSGRFNR
ncbi:MAG: glycosyltransferase family 2 protein [Candidatus Aenigmarchaeota archaeon]|nr:glycosyltransferase family 2 protein [Candidatus Aenigmarchaeota archaeon]